MSRSRKKPIIKDSSHKRKKLASRRFRRTSKVKVKTDKEPPKLNREVTNTYDVCDYVFHLKDKKYTRK